MIRVLIADDHHLVRQGIKALLEKSPDILVIGEAVDGQDAIEQTHVLAPDVLLIDIAMPRLNGLQAIQQIRNQNSPTQIVILSMYSDESLVRQAMQSGVKGYLLKGSLHEELLLAIQAAHQGAIYLSPSVSTTIWDWSSIPLPEKSLARLTPREQEVLQWVCVGKTNAEIAELMTISIKTVERHRMNFMKKLQVHNIVELV